MSASEVTTGHDRSLHWQQVYRGKPSDAVSWYQREPGISLDLIEAAAIDHQRAIIDVGAGASVLVDHLLDRGYRQISVLDIADDALSVSRTRLGPRAAAVDWRVGDVTTIALPPARYALWHDRAVFHFLTDPAARQAYRRQLETTLADDGQIVIATFAEDGPESCSGLPVVRYSADALATEFAASFEPVQQLHETHRTPSGGSQRFVYLRLRRRSR